MDFMFGGPKDKQGFFKVWEEHAEFIYELEKTLVLPEAAKLLAY